MPIQVSADPLAISTRSGVCFDLVITVSQLRSGGLSVFLILPVDAGLRLIDCDGSVTIDHSGLQGEIKAGTSGTWHTLRLSVGVAAWRSGTTFADMTVRAVQGLSHDEVDVSLVVGP